MLGASPLSASPHLPAPVPNRTTLRELILYESIIDALLRLSTINVLYPT